MFQRLLADRMNSLKTESAFKVLEKANRLEAQGMDVVHLEIGEPDFNTDPSVIGSAVKALNKGNTKYCSPSGLLQLKDYIAKHAGLKRGINIKPEEVVITPGAKPILFFALQAFVNPGDEVIIPNPGYPIYESVVNFCGGIAKHVPIIEKDDNFTLDLDKLAAAITPKTKAIILNSPHNPTGGLIPKDDMGKIAQLIIDKDIIVISDEIYLDIYYGEKPVSIASFPGMKDRTIILDGFSKSYAMTGWRLGYGIMPQPIAEHFSMLAVNSYSCTPPFVQMA
ncbi:MAG: aminotransferase class I/II-fold pyridoxal phosphate-dependent enzyme, partial [Bacillota bacterium]|nr:aminotransferase class I/II-fold pyridoxal phosphate-dependent enzyme [Bacillota bacterium]